MKCKQSYFDKIFEKINTETNGSKNWWNLVKSLLHLKTGVTLAYFHSDGKVESVNDKLNSLHRGYLSIDVASLRSLGFNKSGPIALDVSSIFNISSTSFSVTVICSRPLINISVISGTEVSESLRSAYLQK
jgi:hypothetical protein